jgi:hypothetical protein
MIMNRTLRLKNSNSKSLYKVHLELPSTLRRRCTASCQISTNVRALWPPIHAPETPTLNVASPSSAPIHVQNNETILDNAEIT